MNYTILILLGAILIGIILLLVLSLKGRFST